MRRSLQLASIARIVTVVVREFTLTSGRTLPVLQVAEKGTRVADAAESVESPPAKLLSTQQLGSGSEPAETEQACGGGKHRIFLEFFYRRARAGHSL